MTLPLHRPNTELIAVAWLKTLAGVPSGSVGTTLPAAEAFATDGFVQVVGVVGGSPDAYVPLRNPVVQVDTWAVNPGSKRPPWGKANTLIENILAACFTTPDPIVLRDEYFAARLFEVAATTEPRRIPGDEGGFARYSADLHFHWIQIEE